MTRVTVVHAVVMAGGVLAAPSSVEPTPRDVVYAEPGDPVFRSLYPNRDPVTGFSPVAEPAVAAGRRPPRRPERAECDVGFAVAQPVTRDWSHAGNTYLLASFFVTTDHKPGVIAPCYQPEPWVCVLEKTPSSSLSPVDCTTVEQDLVFAGESSLDTAPFRLSETEKAFAVRLKHEVATRFTHETHQAMILFRLHGRRLSQVLAVPIGRSEKNYEEGAGECSRELVLNVEATKTGGFFDWRILAGRKTGSLPCKLEVGRYRWDGARYVRDSGTTPSGR